MAKRLPYGLDNETFLTATKNKTPFSLAARMPSAELAAKVGITSSISAAMSPADPFADVLAGRRVVRRGGNA